MGPVRGPGGVFAIGVVGRALVEGERDVRAELRLHGHRLLRPHELLGAVHIGAKPDSLLADLQHAALAGPLAPAPLDLIGHRAVGEREDLEASGVGDDRTLPAHEPVQAAQRRDALSTRREHQMERVPEDHLVAEAGHLGSGQGPNAAARRERNERRRAHHAPGRMEPPGSGGSITRTYFEAKAFRVGSHRSGSLRSYFSVAVPLTAGALISTR